MKSKVQDEKPKRQKTDNFSVRRQESVDCQKEARRLWQEMLESRHEREVKGNRTEGKKSEI